MACRWRIRRKLIFGLGLVVVILALLLVGTFKGLASYRATMRTIDSKLVELCEADKLRAAVKVLAERAANPQMSVGDLHDKALQALEDYKVKLQDTVANQRDADNGYQEWQQVHALEERLERLKKALNDTLAPTVQSPYVDRHEETPVKAAIEDLVRTAADLNNIIYSDLYDRIKVAKSDYKLSFTIVLSTSVAAVCLMIGLLRFLYRWLFYPIRDLHVGVNRVAQGDFEHRIELHSGDELEELAAAFNDMTSRLHAVYHDLARQVNERSRQLVRSERLAGVGYLAAGVAHEINNPLASIAFCSEALERRLAEVFASRPAVEVQEREIVTKYLKMIQEEAFRCKKITQRLLEFSRGGQRQREPTDMAELVQGVLDMVQPLPNCKGKELLFQHQESLITWVNAQDIKSVILNLVVNSLDSMDEGGCLKISQRLHDGMAELTFQDTGCGMTAEVLENLFEPFFTRSRTGKGTGLGLSISHRIINQHGGEIEATSPGPGQGSTFTVRLPLKPPAEAPDGGKDNEGHDPEAEFARLNSAKEIRLAA